jgi:hypothetical protein
MFHIVVGANLHPFFSRYPVSAVVFTLISYSPGHNKNCWSAWKSSNRLLLFTRPGIVVTDVLWKITLATWQVHTFNSNSFAWKMSIRRVWDINSEKNQKDESHNRCCCRQECTYRLSEVWEHVELRQGCFHCISPRSKSSFLRAPICVASMIMNLYMSSLMIDS